MAKQDQQQFGDGMQFMIRRIEQYAANLLANGRPPGLNGLEDAVSFRANPLG